MICLTMMNYGILAEHRGNRRGAFGQFLMLGSYKVLVARVLVLFAESRGFFLWGVVSFCASRGCVFSVYLGIKGFGCSFPGVAWNGNGSPKNRFLGLWFGLVLAEIVVWGSCDEIFNFSIFVFKMEAFLAGKSRKFAIYFAAEVTAVLKKKGESEVLSCNLWMVVFAGAGPDCVY